MAGEEILATRVVETVDQGSEVIVLDDALQAEDGRPAAMPDAGRFADVSTM